MRHVRRDGTYLRVCDATWIDCGDTEPSRHFGGRWNAPARFGALYLCADLTVAAANARWIYERDGRFTLFDRRPERRPHLQEFAVRPSLFVDAVTKSGIAALGLSGSYTAARSYARCCSVGARAYDAGEPGIASRSAAEATRSHWTGEELAIFDTASSLAAAGCRRRFGEWYPLPHLR